MEKNKRYLGMVFTQHIEKLIPIIEKHVDQETPLYQMFTVNETTVSFVSFYSKSKLSDIKIGIRDYDFKIDFMLFDISDQGETFDMRCKGLEEYILLSNLIDVDSTEEEQNVMDLDSLLDLVNKNGWKSLTEEQKKQLNKYSEE